LKNSPYVNVDLEEVYIAIDLLSSMAKPEYRTKWQEYASIGNELRSNSDSLADNDDSRIGHCKSLTVTFEINANLRTWLDIDTLIDNRLTDNSTVSDFHTRHQHRATWTS
jgi:hypothetical protein